MDDAGVTSVDLWIGTTGLDVARMVIPVITPSYYLPIHWDGLWESFEDGMPRPFSAPPLEAYLDESGVQVVTPGC